MRTVALAIALLMGGTALAQTSTTSGNMGNAGSGDMAATQDQPATDSSTDQTTTTTTTTTQTGWNANSDQTGMATNAVASTGAVVEPSNANPRRDERGIRVISMAAVVPAGWNGVPDTGTGTGGPLLNPTTGQPVSDAGSYPACSRTVTDKCVQTYERHRR